MATPIPHHYCLDYSEFCGEETSNMMRNDSSSINGGTNVVPLFNYDINSPVSVASFPEASFSDSVLVPQISEIETGFRDFSVSDYNPSQVFEPGEFMVPNFWPPYAYNFNPMPAEDWAIQGKAAMKGEESDQTKVGRYSVEERKDRIVRYLKKRNQRNFNKTIKYACRKTLADKRVRIRGRFAKNNDSGQEEILMNNTDNDTCYEQNTSFHNDMMKYEEDYWLEAAIDNLGQFPYLAS